MGVANSQDRLIDFAVGKAGDLSKWRMADLKFVLGVDVAGDNIMNKRDGACARYLNDCRTYRDNMPKCLFFVGDSAKNIRSTGEAFAHAVDRQYVNAVFGKGDKNPNDLPPGVYRSYGIAENGFDIASCQFAIHYFFETDTTLHQFLRNIAETVRVGGYFIGTTYDGETVYKTLKNVPTNQAWTVLQKGQKIAEITKEYEDTGEFMPEEEDSIGMRIQVYQESINQTIPEYLVNFKYFRYLMELYGFTLVPDEEAQRKTKLPHGTGLFQELFHRMESEIKNGAVTAEEYGQALYMTAEEKKISYLNRYFVFRKVHTVEPENIFKILQSKYGRKKAKPDEEPSSSRKPPTSNIVRTKKLKKKLIIRSVDTGATMEAIQDAPMGTELKVKVRKPKSVTKKLNGGSGEFDSDDDGDYHQIQGGELDGSVDIYALKPYGDKTSERANLYMNVSQRTNPVEQTEEFLKTMVSGDPLEFVHKKVSVRENPDYVA
jgi:hypothetical protein